MRIRVSRLGCGGETISSDPSYVSAVLCSAPPVDIARRLCSVSMGHHSSTTFPHLSHFRCGSMLLTSDMQLSCA